MSSETSPFLVLPKEEPSSTQPESILSDPLEVDPMEEEIAKKEHMDQDKKEEEEDVNVDGPLADPVEVFVAGNSPEVPLQDEVLETFDVKERSEMVLKVDAEEDHKEAKKKGRPKGSKNKASPPTNGKRRKTIEEKEEEEEDMEETDEETAMKEQVPLRKRPRRRKAAKRNKNLDDLIGENEELKSLLDDSYFPSADDDSDASFKSEDDPERLHCVCRQPMGDKLMVCCDKCMVWHHASCMKLSPAEVKKIEVWHCPKCSGKEKKRKMQDAFAEAEQPRLCIVCFERPCRSDDSVFCSDACIGKQAAEAAADKALPVGSVGQVTKPKKAPGTPRGRKPKLALAQKNDGSPKGRASKANGVDVAAALNLMAVPIPADIELRGDTFQAPSRSYEMSLAVVARFLCEAKASNIPIKFKPLERDEVKGGLIYAFKSIVFRGSGNQEHWSKDGFVLQFFSTKKFPIPEADNGEQICEQICSTPTNPGQDPKDLFYRRVLWCSSDPQLVVVHYVGDESTAVINGPSTSKGLRLSDIAQASCSSTNIVGEEEDDDDEVICEDGPEATLSSLPGIDIKRAPSTPIKQSTSASSTSSSSSLLSDQRASSPSLLHPRTPPAKRGGGNGFPTPRGSPFRQALPSPRGTILRGLPRTRINPSPRGPLKSPLQRGSPRSPLQSPSTLLQRGLPRSPMQPRGRCASFGAVRSRPFRGSPRQRGALRSPLQSAFPRQPMRGRGHPLRRPQRPNFSARGSPRLRPPLVQSSVQRQRPSAPLGLRLSSPRSLAQNQEAPKVYYEQTNYDPTMNQSDSDDDCIIDEPPRIPGLEVQRVRTDQLPARPNAASNQSQVQMRLPSSTNITSSSTRREIADDVVHLSDDEEDEAGSKYRIPAGITITKKLTNRDLARTPEQEKVDRFAALMNNSSNTFSPNDKMNEQAFFHAEPSSSPLEPASREGEQSGRESQRRQRAEQEPDVVELDDDDEEPPMQPVIEPEPIAKSIEKPATEPVKEPVRELVSELVQEMAAECVKEPAASLTIKHEEILNQSNDTLPRGSSETVAASQTQSVSVEPTTPVKAPGEETVGSSPKPGSGRKKQPRQMPRRNLAELKQSQYRQQHQPLQTHSSQKTDPSEEGKPISAEEKVSSDRPREKEEENEETSSNLSGHEKSLAGPRAPSIDDDDDDIEILEEQIVQTGPQKKVVQVVVDQDDLNSLRTLGFEVVKPEVP